MQPHRYTNLQVLLAYTLHTSNKNTSKPSHLIPIANLSTNQAHTPPLLTQGNWARKASISGHRLKTLIWGGFFLAKELQHSEDTKLPRRQQLHHECGQECRLQTCGNRFLHPMLSLLQLMQQTDGHNTHTPTWYFIIGHECVQKIQLSSSENTIQIAVHM